MKSTRERLLREYTCIFASSMTIDIRIQTLMNTCTGDICIPRSVHGRRVLFYVVLQPLPLVVTDTPGLE